MLFRPCIRKAALSVIHQDINAGKNFNEHRIVAHKQYRLIIDVNHILAKHFFISDIAAIGDLLHNIFDKLK